MRVVVTLLVYLELLGWRRKPGEFRSLDELALEHVRVSAGLALEEKETGRVCQASWDVATRKLERIAAEARAASQAGTLDALCAKLSCMLAEALIAGASEGGRLPDADELDGAWEAYAAYWGKGAGRARLLYWQGK